MFRESFVKNGEKLLQSRRVLEQLSFESVSVIPHTRWLDRTDSGCPAPHIFESGRPRTGVWSSKEINNGNGLSMIWTFLLKISDNRACSFIHVIVQQLRYQYPLLYQRKSTKAACFRNSASGWLMNGDCCWHFRICIFFDSHRISQQFIQKALHVVLIIQIHALQLARFSFSCQKLEKYRCKTARDIGRPHINCGTGFMSCQT